jgi:hypothetical protein
MSPRYVGAAQPPKAASTASTKDSFIAAGELYHFFVSECVIKESIALEICKNLFEVEHIIDKVQQLQDQLDDEFKELLKEVKCK